MKKGQTELIGIVIIVVLLIFGALFFMKLPSKVETGEFETVYAGNTLSVILNYVPLYGCRDKNIGDLLRDCKFKCGYLGDACKCPCEFAEAEIRNVLDLLLEEEGSFRDYYFNAVKYGNEFIKIDKNCENNVGIYAPRYFVSGYEFKLKLCK